MSYLSLERTDNFNKQKSYLKIYNVQKFYIDSEFRPLLLRVVKKSILGTNFIHAYSKNFLFYYTICNIIIINLKFLIFPKLLYQTKQYSFDFSGNNNDTESYEDNKNKNLKNSSNYVFYRIFIFNLVDILFLLFLTFKYKYQQKKINKYMEKYTQCAIEAENEHLKDYFFCQISKDNNFSIELYEKKKKKFKSTKNKANPFFKYVINFPNIKSLNRYYYKKVLLPKEKEIINNIINILDDIDFKYKKKLLKFLLVIAFTIFYIPLITKLSKIDKVREGFNYFGMLLLILYVQRDNFFKIKSEQIEKVSLLNKDYINDGYYIHIDNYMISIFFLKEKFRNKESIEKIKKLNEELRYELNII